MYSGVEIDTVCKIAAGRLCIRIDKTLETEWRAPKDELDIDRINEAEANHS